VKNKTGANNNYKIGIFDQTSDDLLVIAAEKQACHGVVEKDMVRKGEFVPIGLFFSGLLPLNEDLRAEEIV
jgi:hypothetical protein